jgi:aspartate aminotransferase
MRFLQADELLRNDPDLNHEYLPIAGLPEFTSASQKLILGADSPAIADKRVSPPLKNLILFCKYL